MYLGNFGTEIESGLEETAFSKVSFFKIARLIGWSRGSERLKYEVNWAKGKLE